MKNSSLFFPLKKMRTENPEFKACAGRIFYNNREIKEDLNVFDIPNVIELSRNYKYSLKETLLWLDKDEFMKRKCESDNIYLTVLIAAASVLISIAAVLMCCCLIKKKTMCTKEKEVVDTNDYYFHAKEYDDIEITDKNKYYYE